VCGEHKIERPSAGFSAGSAPRVRGTCLHSVINTQRVGFSPARAGNMCCMPLVWPLTWVQPRSCGEHRSESKPFKLLVGFSPARAGNIYEHEAAIRQLRVQPRLCGEHDAWHVTSNSGMGSAPRVRGTSIDHRYENNLCGFSPARAGSIPTSTKVLTLLRVQPRVCGEHRNATGDYFDNLGSAPLMRETFLSSPVVHSFYGFSPARTGNIEFQCSFNMLPWVQPRTCGEHLDDNEKEQLEMGSAPRVRGTFRIRT
jgi:hypothetical protein